MPTEQKQNVRAQVKKVLSGIAIALLAFQLLSLVFRGGNNSTGTLVMPTFVGGNSSVSSGDVSGADTSHAMCSAIIRATLLNQRSGPGENYEVIGGAGRGEEFVIEGQDATSQWLLAKTASGSVWMFARYMSQRGNCDSLPIYGAATNTTEWGEATSTSSEGNTETANAGTAATATPQPIVSAAGSYAGAGAASVAITLSTIFTAEVQFWTAQIMTWAAEYQINPNLIATVIQIESCGNPTISSSAGAQGLFQVMPFHFSAGEDMLDVETNARRGLEYLQGALRIAQGDVELALAGYNGGHGIIYGRWATETQRYAYWGSNIYLEAISGASTSPTLQEWLTAGGSNLCARASVAQQMV